MAHGVLYFERAKVPREKGWNEIEYSCQNVRARRSFLIKAYNRASHRGVSGRGEQVKKNLFTEKKRPLSSPVERKELPTLVFLPFLKGKGCDTKPAGNKRGRVKSGCLKVGLGGAFVPVLHRGNDEGRHRVPS